MANECCFCNERRVPTNILVIGDQWLEFCQPCGNKETLTNVQTGETRTVREVFDGNYVSKPEPVVVEIQEFKFEANFFDGPLFLDRNEYTVPAYTLEQAQRIANGIAEEEMYMADKGNGFEVFPKEAVCGQ